jgi:hypothetical protein
VRKLLMLAAVVVLSSELTGAAWSQRVQPQSTSTAAAGSGDSFTSVNRLEPAPQVTMAPAARLQFPTFDPYSSFSGPTTLPPSMYKSPLLMDGAIMDGGTVPMMPGPPGSFPGGISFGAPGLGRTPLAGIEATYLYPRLRRNHILLIEETFEDEVVETTTLSTQNDFDYRFAAAPRVWLGAENAYGGGVRARYWQYTNSDNFYTAQLDPWEVFIEGDSHLDAFTLDLEATRRFCFATGDILASLGGRHASITHEESISLIQDIGAASAGLSRRTYGTGFTGAAEGRRAIGASNFALFGNARGSVLWGNTSANARAITSAGVFINDDHELLVDGDVDADRQTDRLYIIETQTGLEWSRFLHSCHGLVFARAAFEYQRWSGEDDATAHAQAMAGPLSALARSPSGRTHLLGAAFTIGLSR